MKNIIKFKGFCENNIYNDVTEIKSEEFQEQDLIRTDFSDQDTITIGKIVWSELAKRISHRVTRLICDIQIGNKWFDIITDGDYMLYTRFTSLPPILGEANFNIYHKIDIGFGIEEPLLEYINLIREYILNPYNEVSGTEDISSLGVASPRTQQPITLETGDTEVVYTELTGVIYTFDQYNQMYNDYLKIGGTPLFGFNRENLDTVLVELDKNDNV